jgi:DDE superfamily endonuclease/Helix-turn-helix of DDE superfamily endonuclease
MLTYTGLKDHPTEFLAATGLTVAEFEQLLPAYQEAYAKHYPAQLTAKGKARQRRVGGGSKGVLQTDADRLLFILVYLKTNPLQVMQGLQFDLSQAQANYWIHRLLAVVHAALDAGALLPERDGKQVAASKLAGEGLPDLALDGTERRRERPKESEQQKSTYSGKKKTHTVKNIILVNETTGKVVYLGPTEPGSKHDKKAADEAAIRYPINVSLDKDTGFQGYEPAHVLTRQIKKSLKAKN